MWTFRPTIQRTFGYPYESIRSICIVQLGEKSPITLRRKSWINHLESVGARVGLSSLWVGRRPMGTQNPPIRDQSVSDTWSFANAQGNSSHGVQVQSPIFATISPRLLVDLAQPIQR